MEGNPKNAASKMETVHPLQTPRIVKHLFKLALPSMLFSDLKNARTVCRAWFEETLSWWRANSVVIFYEAPFLAPATRPGTHPNIFLGKLLEPGNVLSLRTKPFRQYKLLNLPFNPEFVEQDAMAASFWAAVGSSVKHLILDTISVSVNSDTSSVQQKLLQFFREKLPNLEKLTIINLPLEIPTDRSSKFPLLGLTSLNLNQPSGFFLSDFPNLQELKLSDNAHLDLMFTFRELSLSTPWENPTLRSLDIMNSYEEESRILRQAQLSRLQHLALSVHSTEDGYHDLRINAARLAAILKTHASTLKTLHVLNLPIASHNEDPLFTCELPVLTELRLWGNLIDDLEFLKYLPHLKYLHIDVLGFGKAKYVRQRDKPAFHDDNNLSSNLEKDVIQATLTKKVTTGVRCVNLTHLFLSCQLSKLSVLALGEWLPNLKAFEAVLNSETLQVTAEMWKELEYLHCLFGSDILDTDQTALIKLLKLRGFQYDCVCEKSKITNGSALLELPELNRLQICVSERFTMQTELLLKQKIPHVKIFKNHDRNGGHQNWKCCRFKEYKEYLTTPFSSDYDGSQSEQSYDANFY